MRNQSMRRVAAAFTMAAMFAAPIVAQQGGQVQQQGGDQSKVFTLSVRSEIVLTNVVVRDKKTGAVVKDLKASDFEVFEDGKQQRVASFDFQNVDQAVVLNEKTVSGHAPTIAEMMENSIASDPKQLRDHRLIVLFFDLSSMQQEDIDRSVEAAQKYINEQMAPADLVSVVSLSTSLQLDHDFTSNKQALLAAVGKYNGSDGQGFAAGDTGDSEGTADDGSSFTADDTEYNNLNTDRELYAIQTICKSLESVDQKKSMLYFSGGLSHSGIENQASLRAATNAAVKANLSIYSVDSRGLEALPPVGNASTGSLRGVSSYNGKAMQSRLDKNFNSQETLASLSSDTGGKAFFNSNDFGPAFQQVQHDTEAYYIIGFRSSNPARDGRYRHLTVKLKRPDAVMQYRPGYYAPADFQHQKTEDRELALTMQLRSDLPATDVPVYLQALYFRLADNRYFIPVSLIVPGSAIPFIKNGDKDKATIDIMGEVKNAQKIPVGNIRETVKLQLGADQEVQRKNIQYNTGFTLAPGNYHLKLVVRENQTGAMGSFETDLNVPDLKKQPMKLSSVVLASQRVPNTQKRNQQNPMVRDGVEWVSNVPHVFRQDQHMFVLYEVYDPAKQKAVADADAATTTAASASGLKARPSANGVHVLTSIEFLQGGSKVYETPLVDASALNIPDRGAVAFQFDVPLDKLKPGAYICQVNVIDDAGGTFTFPRTAVRVTAAAVPAPVVPATPAPNAASAASAGN